jgi:hypothetical protein
MLIGTRNLKLRKADRDVDVLVELFSPECADDGTWFCNYRIGWPEGRWESRAGGVDSIQALVLALQMIGSDVNTSNYRKSGQLYLDAPGRGYGFPVPPTLRDLLVGDDKTFL